MASRGKVSGGKKDRGRLKDNESNDSQRKIEFLRQRNNQEEKDKVEEEGKNIIEKGKEKGKEIRFSFDSVEEVRKEVRDFKEEIKREREDLKKEIKNIRNKGNNDRRRYTDSVEEEKKKERNWEIRMRIVEDKLEEIDKSIRESKRNSRKQE